MTKTQAYKAKMRAWGAQESGKGRDYWSEINEIKYQISIGCCVDGEFDADKVRHARAILNKYGK